MLFSSCRFFTLAFPNGLTVCTLQRLETGVGLRELNTENNS